jgi:hypothetical protein
MARANIAALLKEKKEEGATTATAAVAPPAVAKPREEAARPMSAAAGREEVPPYLRLERKETRVRADQYAALTSHARRLNRAKGKGGERITENTLIRVAIDLLLPYLDQASGQDEAEILKSVSTEVRAGS